MHATIHIQVKPIFTQALMIWLEDGSPDDMVGNIYANFEMA